MKTQLNLKRLATVVGLVTVAGVAFLIGQMSAPSAVSAQSPCVVAATHTGAWAGGQTLWDGGRPAVVTIINQSDSSVELSGDMRSRNIEVRAFSGGTDIGRRVTVLTFGGQAKGTYMITTTVPCP